MFASNPRRVRHCESDGAEIKLPAVRLGVREFPNHVDPIPSAIGVMAVIDFHFGIPKEFAALLLTCT